MKRNKLLVLSLCAMACLAGCGENGENGGNQQGNNNVPTGGYALRNVIKDDVTIEISTTFNDDYQAVINDAIEAFKAIEPKVTIKNTKESSDYNGLATKIINGFGAGEYPDITAVYPDSVHDFINNDRGLDIQDYLYDKDIGFTTKDFEDISDGYIKEGQSYVMPGTYSMPLSKSTEVMYYNADALLGLTLANVNGGEPLTEAYFNNMTWEELFDVFCPAIKAYNDAADAKDKIYDATDAKSCIVGYDSDDNWFITLAQQYGYGYTSVDDASGRGKIDFNNDGMKGLMKKLNGYYKAKYIQTQGTNGTYTSNLATTNKCLISIGSSAGAKNQFSSTLKFDVGVAPLPYAKDGKRAVISQGPSMAFLDHKDENRAKAAWLFYRFFSTTEYNTRWAIASNYLPIRYSVYEDPSYSAFSVVSDKAKNTVEICKARTGAAAKATAPYLYTSPVFKGSSEARSQVKALLTGCLTAEDINTSIDTLFKTAYDNTLLKM
mgnify:CR=1 FL=1